MPRYKIELSPVDVRAMLSRLGLSERDLCDRYVIAPTVLMNAILGTQPTLLRAYLACISADPDGVARAIRDNATNRHRAAEVSAPDPYGDL